MHLNFVINTSYFNERLKLLPILGFGKYRVCEINCVKLQKPARLFGFRQRLFGSLSPQALC
jgi:hypothetical protein